ncbi:MAG: protein-glutamate O-methyltransferase CheR [Gammaproteobacteria bacterium]|nr:protein-glutamate O-methyltransferase CheR [Gammaproteobacteria bacterium]
MSAPDYEAFRRYLQDACGILLGDNKQYLVASRLAQILRENQIDSLAELISRIRQMRYNDLRQAVIDAMTTNETLWFRDTYPFEVLMSQIYPGFKGQNQPVRIWCAACSSGQEPYSISMTTEEYLMRAPGALPGGVQIVGTDISAQMLKLAEQGKYEHLSLARGLSPERKQRFFESVDNGERWQIKANIRRRCSFRPLNLMDAYTPLGRHEIVFCRNVLIYFSADLKAKIIDKIANSLQPRGYLFLGASESMAGLSERFEMIRCNPGIVYRLK